MPMPSIEREPIVVLDCGGIPAKLADCRRLHPCLACRGARLLDGKRCGECQGVGVAPIQGVALTYCPSCSRTNRDFDPRLRLLPGDTPRPEPPKVVVPEELVHERHGDLRTMTAAERHKEQRRIARIDKAQSKRAKAKSKAERAAKKAAERAADKARERARIEKRKAERAAEKARPKYIAPWKQAPPA